MCNKSAKKWKHYLVCVVNFRFLQTIGVVGFPCFFLLSFYVILGIFIDLGVLSVDLFVRGEGQKVHFWLILQK